MSSTFTKFILSLSLGVTALPALYAEGEVAAQSSAATKDVSTASGETVLPKDTAVVAVVDGVNITFKDIRDVHAVLPEQLKQLPFEKLYDILVQRVIELKLLDKKADEAGIAKDAEVKKRIDETIKTIYKKELLNREIKKLINQDMLMKKYQEIRTAIEKDKNREKQIQLIMAFFDSKSEAEKFSKEAFATPQDFVAKASKAAKTSSGKEPVTVTESMLAKSFPENTVKQIFSQKQSSKKMYVISDKENKYMVAYAASNASHIPVPSFEEAAPQIAKAMEGELTQKVIDQYRKNAKIKVFNLEGKEEKVDEYGLSLRLKEEMEKARQAAPAS